MALLLVFHILVISCLQISDGLFDIVWSELPVVHEPCSHKLVTYLVVKSCSFDFPFYGSTERSIEQAAKRGVYEPLPSHYSKKLTDLVSLCLQVDPTCRPNIDTIIDDLEELNYTFSGSTTLTPGSRRGLKTTMPIGIETVRNGVDGFMSVLFEAGTPLNQGGESVSKKKVYATYEDNQTSCFIQVPNKTYLCQ